MTKHLLCDFFIVIQAFCANFDYLRRWIERAAAAGKHNFRVCVGEEAGGLDEGVKTKQIKQK